MSSVAQKIVTGRKKHSVREQIPCGKENEPPGSSARGKKSYEERFPRKRPLLGSNGQISETAVGLAEASVGEKSAAGIRFPGKSTIKIAVFEENTDGDVKEIPRRKKIPIGAEDSSRGTAITRRVDGKPSQEKVSSVKSTTGEVSRGSSLSFRGRTDIRTSDGSRRNRPLVSAGSSMPVRSRLIVPLRRSLSAEGLEGPSSRKFAAKPSNRRDDRPRVRSSSSSAASRLAEEKAISRIRGAREQRRSDVPNKKHVQVLPTASTERHPVAPRCLRGERSLAKDESTRKFRGRGVALGEKKYSVIRDSIGLRRISRVDSGSEDSQAGGESLRPNSEARKGTEAQEDGASRPSSRTRPSVRYVPSTKSLCDRDRCDFGRDERRNEERGAARRYDLDSAITPADGNPPLVLLPAKAMVRQARGEVNADADADAEVGADANGRRRSRSKESREPFPAELLYHAEYQKYLPIVEKEKEERSPRLSPNFLREHINAEQRKLIVVFLIHSAAHCRYPSYVVYHAVKLFDAVVDRIPVETAYMQLTALAALWIALKDRENFHRIPSATTMVALAKDMYLGREDLLISYERKILLALRFNVNFVDAFSLFTYHLISCKHRVSIADDAMAFIYNCGGCLIDLTLLDEKFCRTSSRLIAATAAELALAIGLDFEESPARPRWQLWRELARGDSPDSCCFPDETIDALRVAIIRRVLSFDRKHSDFEVLYKKYSRSRYGRIAGSLVERIKRISYAEIFDPM